eukprot:CAMPEP_0184485358 /NCGR_PEP_ID=MMETSP0113_2-20130426/6973_1 /TAXON_ID=91329 /ORGANISM="Norrisiella sphaerica, Strain BC52" /LENGTH=258 /DNA_ID=CAMNT_0026866769 /DNA_START=69 /DNA_END=845 /DNA_ORIENTATION=+
MNEKDSISLEQMEWEMASHLRRANFLKNMICKEKLRRQQIQQQIMSSERSMTFVAKTDPTANRRLNRSIEPENNRRFPCTLPSDFKNSGVVCRSSTLPDLQPTFEAGMEAKNSMRMDEEYAPSAFAVPITKGLGPIGWGLQAYPSYLGPSCAPPNFMNMNMAFQMSAQKQRAMKEKRMLQCPHCPKSFQNKSRLERHIRSHTGERPFQCTVCGDRFKQKCHLRVHLRRHREFCCPMCDANFAEKNDLLKHVTTHVGQS